ncbi:MAG: hypothetical protein SOZ65_00135 [Erysipelotrichaceae bacterium]|nr:hypothetical protein [Erysipelotrichaceae bacterium]
MKKKHDSIEDMKFVKKALIELQKIRRKGERLWQKTEIQLYQKQ